MRKGSLLPYVVASVTGAGALLANSALHALWPEWRWHHEPLHSAIEAVGGLVAIATATVLLQIRDEGAADKYRMLAAGFLDMGILEEFHAITPPGNGFVLFREQIQIVHLVEDILERLRLQHELDRAGSRGLVERDELKV